MHDQRPILSLLIILLSTAAATAQMAMDQLISDFPEATVVRVSEPIKIDGVVEEATWFAGKPATNFWENFPRDTVQADFQTEIFMAADDQFLYIAAKCYSSGKEYVTPSLRRDYRAGGNDNITFVLDPFRDRTNAFVFGMNPYGVSREALISNGGRDGGDFREEWDNKWRGDSKIFDGYWSCELAIPLSTLRFPADQQEWYFNSYRFDTQSNTRTSWNRIPRNQPIMSLAYMGRMFWEEPPVVKGAPLTIIPYLTGSVQRDFEEGLPNDWSGNVGADAKIQVTSGLNLDLTVNPDFSQVEVDRQQVNLTRFELFFPERRQFFLENADLFSRFGFDDINPFFSRRIGVTRDTSTGEAIQNSIFYGARLSGKLDNNWRIGLLNMQADKNDNQGLPSYNYTVAALQRKVGVRSNIGLIAVNKETFSNTFSDTLSEFSEYNRVLGFDYNLATPDNAWTGKTFFQYSFSPEQESTPFAHGVSLEHRKRKFAASYSHAYVGEGFNAEVGFVPRVNYFTINPEFRYFFYDTNGPFNQHGPGLRTQILWTPGEGRTDQATTLFWDFNLANQGGMWIGLRNEYTFLLEDFDPTRSDEAVPLPGRRGYNYSSASFFYRSDPRPAFSYRVDGRIGEFFSGNRYGTGLELTYRYQPFGQITLNVDYTYIDLPEPHASTGIFLIGPRIDLTFSRSIFLTTFLQYNDQIDNLNINARLQWRFAPVSDFFLVYTDNYGTEEFGVKNRALVAKVTYWLNI